MTHFYQGVLLCFFIIRFHVNLVKKPNTANPRRQHKSMNFRHKICSRELEGMKFLFLHDGELREMVVTLNGYDIEFRGAPPGRKKLGDLSSKQRKPCTMTYTSDQNNLQEVRQSLDQFCTKLHPFFDSRLIDFYREGFRATTLSSVPNGYREYTLLTKLHLAILMILLDNHVRTPSCEKALERLSQISLCSEPLDPNFEKVRDQEFFNLVLSLRNTLIKSTEHLPQFLSFQKFLEFDLSQILQSYRYTQLVLIHPSVTNPSELSTYGPHTMGQIVAGMIDLMASPHVVDQELGSIRTMLAIGQRMVRISNILATFQRELTEGDMTNELTSLAIEQNGWTPPSLTDQMGLGHKSLYKRLKRTLKAEHTHLFVQLERYIPLIKTFDVSQYKEGLRSVHRLHERMRFVL